MIESWLKRLVLQQDLLISAQCFVQRTQRFDQGAFAPADIGLARVIRSVRQPDGHQLAARLFRQFGTLEQMLDGDRPDSVVAVTEGTIFVDLILKQVGVNRPNANPVLLTELDDRGSGMVSHEIPENMNSHGRTKTGKGMDLSGVG